MSSYLLPVLPLLLIALGLVIPSRLSAQGLPPFAPINPVATSRTGLSFEPYRDPMPGQWTASAALDYASTIEFNHLTGASYLLDSELLRLRFGVRRDLGRRAFLLADGELRGVYAGFLDGFLDWYHGLLGLEMPERDRRPRDEFLYSVESPRGDLLESAPTGLFLGDLRLGVGVRVTRHLQSIAALTLPSASGPEAYGLGVASFALLNTVRAPINPRLVYEGSLSAGYTSAHGGLASAQHEVMVAASSGLRWQLWGRQSLYGNLFYHSPYYEGTTLPSLDRRELSFDFGWILATGGGEWRVGMTEDLEPAGPAIDLIFRFGTSF